MAIWEQFWLTLYKVIFASEILGHHFASEWVLSSYQCCIVFHFQESLAPPVLILTLHFCFQGRDSSRMDLIQFLSSFNFGTFYKLKNFWAWSNNRVWFYLPIRHFPMPTDYRCTKFYNKLTLDTVLAFYINKLAAILKRSISVK